LQLLYYCKDCREIEACKVFAGSPAYLKNIKQQPLKKPFYFKDNIEFCLLEKDLIPNNVSTAYGKQ